MLKHIVAKFRPSPAMIVALLGVAIALGSTGWAANGAAFLLGRSNSATAPTVLSTTVPANAGLVVVNNSATATTALTLSAPAGKPPMKVGSAVKVANLNADWLDGLDSTALTRVRRIPFNLASGASTAPIVLPANVPVHVMATGNGCAGAATMVGSGGVTWTGAGSCFGASSSPNGIAYDDGHEIFIFGTTGGGAGSSGLSVQVVTGGAIRVHNGTTAAYSGQITLVW